MNTASSTEVDSPQMSHIDVPGARLSCESSGDGTVLMQMHGLTSSSARDEALQLNLAEDVPGRRMVRYDARGHGRSTGTAEPADYTWPNLARDLHVVLDHYAPDQSVDAIGQSMGAGTLMHAAVADPSRFRTMTFVIPPTAWSTRPAQSESYRAGAELAEREGIEAFTRVATAFPRPPAAPPAPRLGPDVEGNLLPSILRGAAASDLPDPETLRKLDIPTLILAWVDDASHPLSTSEALVEALPDARLVVARTPEETLTWGRLAAEHITSAR